MMKKGSSGEGKLICEINGYRLYLNDTSVEVTDKKGKWVGEYPDEQEAVEAVRNRLSLETK